MWAYIHLLTRCWHAHPSTAWVHQRRYLTGW
ncbi:unnamed protein product [Linum tenue]|uniref:Uncharacterized protein n=1 Tax=Linum tenue TaxID=586396 RepID=A0AAV0JN83_9ROSI|nr:unnamed protein product [Linum tenue]